MLFTKHARPVPGRSRYRAWLFPLAICAVALVVRLVAVVAIEPVEDIAGYSESGNVARNVLSDRGFTYDFYGLRPEKPLRAFMPPLYVGLIYLASRLGELGEETHLTLALMQITLSCLVPLAGYWIALQLPDPERFALHPERSERTARLVAVFLALYPISVIMVTVPVSLTLHVTLLALALALTIASSTKQSLAWPIGAGVFWGLLALGRPALLGFMPLVVLWLWLNRRPSSPEAPPGPPARVWWQNSAFLIATVAVVVWPWTLRNYRLPELGGRLVPVSTNGGFNFWNGNNPFTTGSGNDVFTERAYAFLGRPHDPSLPEVMQMYPYPLPPQLQEQIASIPEVELDRQLYRAGLNFIREQPRAWLSVVGRKLVAFWWFRTNLGAAYEGSWTRYYRLIYPILLILFAAGLLVSVGQWRRYSLFYLLFAYYTVTIVSFQVLTRFRWEIEPFFLLFAALYLASAASLLPGRLVSPWSRRPPVGG